MLYVIADGSYRATHAGRAEWMSLINDRLLQPYCNKEGFNVGSSSLFTKSRIGILGNDQNDCEICDSIIGFGIGIVGRWSSGNIYFILDIADEKLKTFGYIFVQ